jgi:molecular chaperone Hsp33
MADFLVRAIGEKYNVIALSAVTTDLVDEARRLHGTTPTASAALGRSLTGALLMASLMKRGQRIALKFDGSGPLRRIVVEADTDGTARGYVAVPSVVLPPRNEKLDVSGALGAEGTLTVKKDLGVKEPYTGVVKLLTGEIAEDIAHYYSESEQIPSAVGLGVFVRPDETVAASGGFLLQALPPADEGLLDQLIENVRKISSVTDILRNGEGPEAILAQIFGPLSYHVLGKQDLAFRCPCSRERVERALISLGGREMETLIQEQGEATVTCEYCRTKYNFSRGELNGLLKEILSTS